MKLVFLLSSCLVHSALAERYSGPGLGDSVGGLQWGLADHNNQIKVTHAVEHTTGFETGIRKWSQTNSKSWVEIKFSQTYKNPVVIAGIPSYNGADEGKSQK